MTKPQVVRKVVNIPEDNRVLTLQCKPFLHLRADAYERGWREEISQGAVRYILSKEDGYYYIRKYNETLIEEEGKFLSIEKARRYRIDLITKDTRIIDSTCSNTFTRDPE